jgi:hypothetical protein
VVSATDPHGRNLRFLDPDFSLLTERNQSKWLEIIKTSVKWFSSQLAVYSCSQRCHRNVIFRKSKLGSGGN